MCVCVCVCVCVIHYPPLPTQAIQRFYDTVMQAVLRHVRFDGELSNGSHLLFTSRQITHKRRSLCIGLFSIVVKCILVASPGFVKVGVVSVI